MKKVLVVYKSVTGFTREYGAMLAKELGCPHMELKAVTAETMSGFDTIVFGGRMHAGMLDGLKQAKALFAKSGAKQLVIYATGATPNEAKETVDGMWANNLTPDELERIPHFYLQSGLRYESMPLSDRLMMKVFSTIMGRKKNKTPEDEQFNSVIASSYDISSPVYLEPLLDLLSK